jgi:hypothetical protein
MLGPGDEYKLVKALLDKGYYFNLVKPLFDKLAADGNDIIYVTDAIKSGKISSLDNLYNFFIEMGFRLKNPPISQEEFDNELSKMASGPVRNVWLTTQRGGRKNRKNRKTRKARKSRSRKSRNNRR